MKGTKEISNYDLFDNPMVRSARESMSQETLDEYKRIGEDMYNQVEFETGTVLNNTDDPFVEFVAYTAEALKSGMDPSYLNPDEIRIMEEHYQCKDWYQKHYASI
jgi:hypothetical protein